MTFHGPGVKKYPRVAIKGEDGSTQAGYRVTCAAGRCKRHFEIRAKTGSLAVEVIERKIRSAGWVVNTKSCYCPKHASGRKSVKVTGLGFLSAGMGAAREAVGTELDKLLDMTAERIVADEPQPIEIEGRFSDMKVDTEREPTRDQKRAILREIDGQWDDKASRYIGPVTDQSIATKLNVPRNWVENCRVEFYGDTGKNEEFDKLLGQAKNAVAASRKLEEEAMTLAGKLEGQRSTMEALINKMEKLS